MNAATTRRPACLRSQVAAPRVACCHALKGARTTTPSARNSANPPPPRFHAADPGDKTVTSFVELITFIDRKLTHADSLAADDAGRYHDLISAATEAMSALQREYIDILREAAEAPLGTTEARERPRSRIQAYLTGEELRPRLVAVLARLHKGRSALAEHADRLLIWPSARAAREIAVLQYERLVADLHRYVERLNHGKLKGASGVGVHDLV